MKRFLTTLAAFILTAALPLVSACAADTTGIPAGTTLQVRLDTTITSKTNKPGDTFNGMVMEEVVSGDQTIVPKGSLVTGHIAFIKPSGRVRGKAQMRIVLDSITTPEEKKFQLSSTLEESRGGPCGSSTKDEEGTIEGCGKSKKDAAKDSAIGAAMGAGAGAGVAMGSEIECRYYGRCGGPGIGTSLGVGAGIGAGTALLYNIFKHEKQIVLVQGSELTFVVNRTIEQK